MNIVYTENKSEVAHVLKHLIGCSPQFNPPLDQTTNIYEYAEKIAQKSHRFEAWHQNTLVGLIAAYINNDDTRIAYITNVSVDQHYVRLGIARTLLENCIKSVAKHKFNEIHLEVGATNIAAINLYKDFDFTEMDAQKKSSDRSKITLSYTIKV